VRVAYFAGFIPKTANEALGAWRVGSLAAKPAKYLFGGFAPSAFSRQYEFQKSVDKVGIHFVVLLKQVHKRLAMG